MKLILFALFLTFAAHAQEDLIEFKHDFTDSETDLVHKQAMECLGKHLDDYYSDCDRYPPSLHALISKPKSCTDGPKQYVAKLPKQARSWIYTTNKDASEYTLKVKPGSTAGQPDQEFLATCKE